MGGFKSAVNLDFLRNHHIGLIICAAKDLAKTFGPKYQKLVEKRSQELSQIKVVTVPWNDTPQQVLDEATFEQSLGIFHKLRGLLFGSLTILRKSKIFPLSLFKIL